MHQCCSHFTKMCSVNFNNAYTAMLPQDQSTQQQKLSMFALQFASPQLLAMRPVCSYSPEPMQLLQAFAVTSMCKLLCSLEMYSSSCAYLSIQLLPIVGNIWIIFGRPYLACLLLLFTSTIREFEGLYDDTVYCLLFMVKNVRCFMSSPSFPQILRLPIFTSFHSIHVQIIYQKTFTVVKKSTENMKVFHHE